MLKAAHPDEIRTKHCVTRNIQKQQYHSPLSWKNGCWHHIVPANLSNPAESKVSAEAQRLLGLVQLAFPDDERALIFAMTSEDPYTMGFAQSQASALKDVAGDRVELQFSPFSKQQNAIDELRRRIEQDLTHQRS